MILLVAVGLANTMHESMPAPKLPYRSSTFHHAWQCWYWGQLEGSFGRRNGRWHFSDIVLKRVVETAA